MAPKDDHPPVEDIAPVPAYEDTASQPSETGISSKLARELSNRQIQWIAIGGSIGTALFISIAWGLVEGGPGSLFISFALYSCFMALANSCMAEMSVFMPVVGGWVSMVSITSHSIETSHR